MISEHALMVLTLMDVSGIKNAWISKYLSRPTELSDILHFIIQKDPHFSVDDYQRRREVVRSEVAEYLHSQNCLVVVLGEAHFPPVRGNVPPGERPVALFYRGDLELLDPESTNVAMIGLLDPDPQTKADESLVVSRLVERGCVIVSGLARGCDTQAHRTALDRGGKTVAVLPSTFKHVLPVENAGLADEIVEKNGLLITEYFREAKTAMEQSGRYVTRDRLQALFSDLIVLAASYPKNDVGLDSGSRHAMNAAAKYGLMRGVLPDRSAGKINPKYGLNKSLRSEDQTVLEIDPEMIRSLVISNRSKSEIQDAFIF